MIDSESDIVARILPPVENTFHWGKSVRAGRKVITVEKGTKKPKAKPLPLTAMEKHARKVGHTANQEKLDQAAGYYLVNKTTQKEAATKHGFGVNTLSRHLKNMTNERKVRLAQQYKAGM